MKRGCLLVAGLFICGFGVAIIRRGSLGVSPISSVANVLSLRFPSLSFGVWLMIWNCILILGQALVLGRNFRLVELLQLPLSVLFGWFTDIGVRIAELLPAEAYILRLLWVILGIFVMALGICLSVKADLIMNSGEAFVKAVSARTGREFGNVKIVFDISCVLLSIVLSLLLFSGQIVGTREGTLLSAVGTGLAVKLFFRLLPH